MITQGGIVTYLVCPMECCLDPLDLLHISVWLGAHGERLEMKYQFKKKF